MNFWYKRPAGVDQVGLAVRVRVGWAVRLSCNVQGHAG